MTIYSSRSELSEIQRVLYGYLKLPIAEDCVPGKLMEAVIAHVRQGRSLSTYDYVDVIQEKSRVGWSVKSTKSSTPLTWKRAKIANKSSLIAESLRSDEGLEVLGLAILDFCNKHAIESMERYGLDAIGYARLILFPDGTVRYFERALCDRANPNIFDPALFEWRWSSERAQGRKEQLRALHGFHRQTGERWWAWHGHGENQLHFTGEKAWWPSDGTSHATAFRSPSAGEKVSLERLTALLEEL